MACEFIFVTVTLNSQYKVVVIDLLIQIISFDETDGVPGSVKSQILNQGQCNNQACVVYQYEQIAQVEEEGNDPLGGEFTATPDRGRLIFEKTNENKR